MRLFISAAIAASCLLSSPVRAQDPAQIFGLIMGEVERRADRARQRKWQREQHRQQQAHWQSFLALWRTCFDQNDLSACDQALAYPDIGTDNEQRLHAQVTALMAAQQSAREDVRRRIAEAEARVRHLEAARSRLAEAQRDIEAQRLADTRALARDLDDCRRFEVAACDRATASSMATTDDQTRIASWRQTAEQFALDREACRAGSVAACDQAALSAAADAEQRRQIAEWRRAASPIARFAAVISDTAATVRDVVLAIPREIAALPRSTQIAGSLSLLLATALGVMLWRQRASSPAASTAPGSPRHASNHTLAWRHIRALANRLHRLGFRLHVRLIAALRRRATKNPAQPNIARPTAKLDRPRDPETAMAAMQLARAYLAEFDGKITELVGDSIAGKAGLNTLSLVSQQLTIAERADPSAMLEVELDNGASVTFTLAELKAEALYVEAVCRSSEKPRRAIGILEQAAALDPSDTRIPYFAGLLHMDLMQKRAAIAAFERALAIDPDNMQFRKMLVRAQSLSGAEVAYHKAATGVRRGVEAVRLITLLVQLAPLVLLVLSILLAGFVHTPQAQFLAAMMFISSIIMTMVFGLLRRARQWLSVWHRENSW